MRRAARAIVFGICAVLAACALVSCGNNSSAPSALSPPGGGDSELSAETQIQKLLGEINTQEGEVAKLMRAAGPNLTVETRNKGQAARHDLYSSADYVKTLQAAQAALQGKVTARAAERAALENAQDMASVAKNALAGPKPVNAPPDEQAEEMKLKARLLDVQQQTEEMAQAAPAGADATPETRQKAAAARDDLVSPEQYADSLHDAQEALERKLAGLNAEAAFYENLLGLNSDTNTPATNR